MPARTAALAVASFLDDLQHALSCVTDTVLSVGGGYRPNPAPSTPHIAVLAEGDAVPLTCDTPLWARVAPSYRVVPTGLRGHAAYRVQTAAYYNALAAAEDKEYIAYHWHPEARSAVRFPHLHIGPAAVVPRSLPARAHFPTGYVALENILRLAITGFGVQPRRSDWDQVLRSTHDSFEAERTWPGCATPPGS